MATLVSQRLNLHLLVGYGGCLCARILAASTFDNAKEKSSDRGGRRRRRREARRGDGERREERLGKWAIILYLLYRGPVNWITLCRKLAAITANARLTTCLLGKARDVRDTSDHDFRDETTNK